MVDSPTNGPSPAAATPTDEASRLARLLHGVSDTIIRLTRQRSETREEIADLLAVLGEAAAVDRVYVFENSRESGTNRSLMSQRYEWAGDEVAVQLDNPELQNLAYDEVPDDWLPTLSRGACVTVLRETTSGWFREELERQRILSMLLAPIILHDGLWGFVGFDDCHSARQWSEVECSALTALAGALGSVIARQQTEQLIEVLSAPVAEVWQGILSLPIMGVLDSRRAARITDELLNRVTELKARIVLLDLTGIEAADTATTSYLIRIARSTNLLGAECYVTGLSPSVARSLVQLGADLSVLRTFRTLRDGLKAALESPAIAQRNQKFVGSR